MLKNKFNNSLTSRRFGQRLVAAGFNRSITPHSSRRAAISPCPKINFDIHEQNSFIDQCLPSDGAAIRRCAVRRLRTPLPPGHARAGHFQSAHGERLFRAGLHRRKSRRADGGAAIPVQARADQGTQEGLRLRGRFVHHGADAQDEGDGRADPPIRAEQQDRARRLRHGVEGRRAQAVCGLHLPRGRRGVISAGCWANRKFRCPTNIR